VFPMMSATVPVAALALEANGDPVPPARANAPLAPAALVALVEPPSFF